VAGLVFLSYAAEAPADRMHNFTLSVTLAGSGAGTVTSVPAGISCGTACSLSRPHGAHVTLTATPSEMSIFAGWSGGCAGTGTCTVTLNANVTVTATFDAPPPKDLTVARNGTGSGVITSDPAGIDCGSTCSAAYAHGTGVVLTATPAKGSHFAGWSGDCSGAAVCTLTMDAVHSAGAAFARDPECVVPRVIGMTLRTAKRALTAARCSRGRISRKYSHTRKGRVISQVPRAGVHSPVGSAVSWP
jgi:Divergent InlB B-repeat domain/PASTA domain